MGIAPFLMAEKKHWFALAEKTRLFWVFPSPIYRSAARLERITVGEVIFRKIHHFDAEVLLMEEILHQLIGSLSHYLQGFIHPRWCRISSINSMC